MNTYQETEKLLAAMTRTAAWNQRSRFVAGLSLFARRGFGERLGLRALTSRRNQATNSRE